MKILWSKKFIITTVFIAAVYVVTTIYLMNARLALDAIFGIHSLAYRWNLLTALLFGMWTAMSKLSLTLLVIVALLTGANLTLIVIRLFSLHKFGKLQLVAGGSSLLGIIGSGCASCGLPILALLGLSGAAAYLPFRGVEISAVAIILLLISLYSLLKSHQEKVVCAVPNTKIKIKKYAN